ncbi:MAG: ThiF family adenylyltransferase [Deltaproteobacteria bacterium]|nr:ThiF family adenylyltransferase [Deltaproteobacteria bacterium]
MSLRPDQIRRYARHVLLPDVGGVGQKRLLTTSVRIDRAEGAGSVAILYLAAAGVGTLVVTDEAIVGQPDGFLYEVSDIGKRRLDAVNARVEAMNPDVQVVSEGAAELHLLLPVTSDPVEALEVGSAAAGRLVLHVAAAAHGGPASLAGSGARDA